MSKRWVIPLEWDDRDQASRDWGVPPLVAQLLYNRRVRGVDDARRFLAPSLKELHPPHLLPGTTRAAEIVADAVRRGRRIVLYGDYDVDGITGVALLWHLLTRAQANVTFYVPSRLEEGYGLHTQAVAALADDGAELIITVDCGITGVEAAELLRQRRVTLVITDHHEPGATMPCAEAMVHPRLPAIDPAGNGAAHPGAAAAYGNPDLSGSGVAFKLAWAVAQQLSGSDKVSPPLREALLDGLPLAALGTIADVVPLVDENRVLARHGLALLPDSRLPGLVALLECAGLRNCAISGYDVGFKLAPRLNAAGRMGHARLAVELLTRAGPDRAMEIAQVLERENRARQTVERQIFQEACEQIDGSRMAADSRHAIVVEAEKWHAGVIGIVAARIVDRYHRPAILITLAEGQGQGSGRSIAAFDLHAALTACGEHLLAYGGHAMAAGLKIRPQQVGAFREAFVDVANRRLTPVDLLPRLELDGTVALSDLTRETVNMIQSMEPFGQGNPRPRFATDWLELASEPRAVGQDGSHLQVVLRQSGAQIKGIGFGLAGRLEDLKEHRRCRVAVEPMISHYNGRQTVEVRLLDLQFPD